MTCVTLSRNHKYIMTHASSKSRVSALRVSYNFLITSSGVSKYSFLKNDALSINAKRQQHHPSHDVNSCCSDDKVSISVIVCVSNNANH